MVKVREVVTHGNRGRGEDDTLHLGKPAPREVGTHVDLLGAELLLADASLGARELRGVDVGGVLPRADEPDAGEKVAQEAARLLEVRALLRRDLVELIDRLAEKLDRLVEAVLADLARIRDGAPLGRLADALVDPDGHAVVRAIALSDVHEVVHRIEEVPDAHLGTRHGRRGLREQAQDEFRALERRGVDHRSVDDAGLHAAEHLEARTGRLARDLDGPLTARLGLEGVCLVHDPVPHGREDPSVRGHVAEQQGVVGDDHVTARRPSPRAMEQAFVGKVRAAAAEALSGRGGEHLTRHVAPADAQGVEIAVGRLAREGIGHGYGGEHVGRHRVGRPAVHG